MSDFPQHLQNRYEYLGLLGKGGMGNVYLAQDKKLPRKVAIKIVSESLANNDEVKARIKRESQLHGKITSHPNIVTLYDLIEEGGSTALVMEYVDGTTLSSRLIQNVENDVTFSQEKSVELVKQLLSALKRLHSLNVVHRDIKPDNLMIGKDDNGQDVLKLMDFGIAKSEADDVAQTMITKMGHSTPGTPAYMSPEQIDSESFGDVSVRSDIYSVGVILYEMLLGSTPFKGTLTQVFTGHLTLKVADIIDTTKLPPYWLHLISKALEKNPSSRFQTVGEFIDAFDKLSEAQDSTASAGGEKNQNYHQNVKQNATMLWDNEAKKSGTNEGHTQLFNEEDAIGAVLGASSKGNNKTHTPQNRTPLIAGIVACVGALAAGYYFYASHNAENNTDQDGVGAKSVANESTNADKPIATNNDADFSLPENKAPVNIAAPVYQPLIPAEDKTTNASDSGVTASATLEKILENKGYVITGSGEEKASPGSGKATSPKKEQKVVKKTKPKPKPAPKPKPSKPEPENPPTDIVTIANNDNDAQAKAVSEPPKKNKAAAWGGTSKSNKMGE